MLNTSGMTEIIRVMQRYVSAESRKMIYMGLIVDGKNEGWDEARACLGIDPVYDEAVPEIEAEMARIEEAAKYRTGMIFYNTLDAREPVRLAVEQVGGTVLSSASAPEVDRHGSMVKIPADKANELDALLQEIDGLIDQDDESLDAIEPEAPDFTPPSFEGGAPAVDAAADTPQDGNPNSGDPEITPPPPNSNDHPGTFTAPENDAA